MNQKEYNDLLDRFFARKTTAAEDRLLHSITGKDLNEKFERYSRDKWERNDYKMTATEKELMKTDILRRINADAGTQTAVGHQHRSGRNKVWRKVVAGFTIAASIVVAAVAGYLYNDIYGQVQEFEITAERGQKSKVTLPDGSKVWLNSNSRITYASDYNSKKRNITLEGEAYFDVAKNPNLPFIVDAGGVKVKAIGTKFNVRAYRDEMSIRTALVEGKVLTYSSKDKILLHPCQEAIFEKSTGRLTASEVPNTDHLVPWLANEIYLDGMTLGTLAKMLERMYNVEIIFADPQVEKYSYTGLIKNNSLPNVLELISGTSPVKYRINGNTIKFYMD